MALAVDHGELTTLSRHSSVKEAIKLELALTGDHITTDFGQVENPLHPPGAMW